METINLVFILILAAVLGFELIKKVPATLHTPLMSGANAISGVTLIGALAASGSESNTLTTILGTASIAFATMNVVGGYLVTDRMLSMFKSKQSSGDQS